MSEHTSQGTIAVLCSDVPGVLARIVGIIGAQGTNIDGLTVNKLDRKDHGNGGETQMCIPISIMDTSERIDHTCAVIERLVDVERACKMADHPEAVELHLAIARVYIVDPHSQTRVRASAQRHGAATVDDSANYQHFITLSLLADKARVAAFVKEIGAYKRRQIVTCGPFVIL